MLISTLLCLLFKETKDLVLEDTMKKQDVKTNDSTGEIAVITGDERSIETHKDILKEENGIIVSRF